LNFNILSCFKVHGQPSCQYAVRNSNRQRKGMRRNNNFLYVKKNNRFPNVKCRKKSYFTTACAEQIATSVMSYAKENHFHAQGITNP